MKPSPKTVLDLELDGLRRPVRLVNCEPLIDTIGDYFPGWSFNLRDPGAENPIAALAHAGDTFRLTSPLIDVPRFQKTAVNALCDLIAMLPAALAAEQADLMYLHAAAVEIGGVAILFPAVRRSGKSLLSAGLAAEGAGILSDDVVALTAGFGGPLMARASGIATRLRLPLPDGLTQEFLNFLAANPGPENNQYRYLAHPGQPRFGTSFPIGGVVILDRRETGPANLSPEPRGNVLRSLLHQHFTRDRDSAQVMAALYPMAESVPCWRLVYAEMQDAVELIQKAVADKRIGAPKVPPVIRPRGDSSARPSGAVPKGHRFVRAKSADIRDLDGDFFAVSRDGGRIVHLNDGAIRIWTALAEPATADEISAIFAEVFPQIAFETIDRDTHEALALFYQTGLVD